MAAPFQDIRYCLRGLASRPGFGVSVVVTLAVGIGANIAMFSAVNGVLLRPLPFQDPEQLVIVQRHIVERQVTVGFSYPDFLDWREQKTVLRDFAAYTPAQFDLVESEGVKRIPGAVVSGNFFSLLGISPTLGRSLAISDERNGSERVAVISHDLWEQRYGSRPEAVGQTVTLQDVVYTVVGVLPPGFRYPEALGDARIWTVLNPTGPQRLNRSLCWLSGLGRLKPGTSTEQALSLLNDFQNRQAGSSQLKILIVSLRDMVVKGVRPTLWILSAVVGLVLLTVCANVAHLYLARVSSRDREIAIRGALGASRTRLLRQFATEALLLSLAGGGVGMVAAILVISVFRVGVADSVPLAYSVRLAFRELLFGGAISLAVGLFLGIVPLRLVQRAGFTGVLAERSGGSARHATLSSAMIAAQVAFALVLSVGMVLMARSIAGLSAVNAGFDGKNLITFSVSVGKLNEQQRYQFASAFLQRLRALPSVTGASTDSSMPSSPRGMSAPVSADVQPAPGEEQMRACIHDVSPDYFKTLRLAVRKGRDFSLAEQEEKTRVAMVSENLALALWPGRDPVNQVLTLAGQQYRVIGVVADMLQGSVRMEKPKHVFVPFDVPFPGPELKFVVRTESAASPVTSSARAILKGLDPTRPLYGETTFVSQMNASINQERFTTAFLAVFSCISLLLVVTGIYGVVSCTVTERTHEFGIRMALGAGRTRILAITLRQGLALSVIGSLVGIAGALSLTRFLARYLYGVSETDPATFISVTLLVTVVATLACLVPARRAARMDPLAALRHE